MAEVRLLDIIDVTVFQDLDPVNDTETSAFYQSGAAVRTPVLDQLTAAPGQTAELPFWNDLDPDAEPNVSDDNPANDAVPLKVDQGKQTSRKADLNNGWSATDLASDLAMGPEAMQHIRNRTDAYWTKQWNRRIVAASLGVLLDNVANDGEDMVHDISTEDGDNATTANRFSRTAFIRATFTLGDQFENTGSIAVHSHVLEQMVENDDIEFIPDSEGNLTIPTFMGRRVVMDDQLPVIAGTTSGLRFVSVLYGDGAIGWGESSPKTPVATERDESACNGGGLEELWIRKRWTVHPFGFQFTSASVASESATLAELRNAANWNRVVPRKNVPMAFLITN